MTPAGWPRSPLGKIVSWLLAALVGFLLVLATIVVGAVPAAAQNGVGASTPVMINTVGSSADIGAGQRLGKTVPQPQIVVATGVAAETAEAAGGGGGRIFVTTGRGTTYDIPEGWVGRTADNGKGLVYQRPGAAGNANSIRIMEPTPKYPNGYVRVYNDGGQPVDVFGKPGPPSETHIPQDYVGPWPAWPGQ